MADIYLNVGFVSQLTIGQGDYVRKDPTGCWYASAQMVAYYFEQGPRMGVPELFVRKVGKNPDGTDMIGHLTIGVDNWPKLMATEGLEAVEEPASRAWTADALAELLRVNGPLIFAWRKKNAKTGETYGHASVLIGAESSTQQVVIHDPEDQPNFRMSIADFNAKYLWGFCGKQAMLRRADGAYRMKAGLTTAK
jgi:hypothetical protein